MLIRHSRTVLDCIGGGEAKDGCVLGFTRAATYLEQIAFRSLKRRFEWLSTMPSPPSPIKFSASHRNCMGKSQGILRTKNPMLLKFDRSVIDSSRMLSIASARSSRVPNCRKCGV